MISKIFFTVNLLVLGIIFPTDIHSFPNFSKHKRFLSKSNDLQFTDESSRISCSTSQISNLQLDWSRIRNHQQAEVCFLEISRRLKNLNAIVSWFRENGFAATVHDSFGAWPSDRPGTIFATYDFKSDSEFFSHGIAFRFARLTGRKISVSLKLDAQNYPISAQVLTLWE